MVAHNLERPFFSLPRIYLNPLENVVQSKYQNAFRFMWLFVAALVLHNYCRDVHGKRRASASHIWIIQCKFLMNNQRKTWQEQRFYKLRSLLIVLVVIGLQMAENTYERSARTKTMIIKHASTSIRTKNSWNFRLAAMASYVEKFHVIVNIFMCQRKRRALPVLLMPQSM